MYSRIFPVAKGRAGRVESVDRCFVTFLPLGGVQICCFDGFAPNLPAAANYDQDRRLV